MWFFNHHAENTEETDSKGIGVIRKINKATVYARKWIEKDNVP